ncbi:hypothetical protein DEO72_LG2g2683 [Vigna unguiculata]|uniref:Uncharacterized protein n=1 Tax=Vigna unguiculata TaxID=3917 RepID=A0A4D6L1G4_VIGUN|nr:hypothetical protein DEO72_LG2g2683 [Vigna unguiculata]
MIVRWLNTVGVVYGVWRLYASSVLTRTDTRDEAAHCGLVCANLCESSSPWLCECGSWKKMMQGWVLVTVVCCFDEAAQCVMMENIVVCSRGSGVAMVRLRIDDGWWWWSSSCRLGDGGTGEKLGFLFGRWEGDDEPIPPHISNGLSSSFLQEAQNHAYHAAEELAAHLHATQVQLRLRDSSAHLNATQMLPAPPQSSCSQHHISLLNRARAQFFQPSLCGLPNQRETRANRVKTFLIEPFRCVSLTLREIQSVERRLESFSGEYYDRGVSSSGFRATRAWTALR